MMTTADHEYLETRAEAELEAAQKATHPKAVSAHYVLASTYLDLLYEKSGAAVPDDSTA